MPSRSREVDQLSIARSNARWNDRNRLPSPRAGGERGGVRGAARKSQRRSPHPPTSSATSPRSAGRGDLEECTCPLTTSRGSLGAALSTLARGEGEREALAVGGLDSGDAAFLGLLGGGGAGAVDVGGAL